MSKKKKQNKESEQDVYGVGFVVTTTEEDACIPWSRVREYMKECRKAREAKDKIIESQDTLIKTQEGLIKAQAANLEILGIKHDFNELCIAWAKEHMGFFMRRKYNKLFNDKTLFRIIRERKYRNMEEGNDMAAEVDEKILQTL